MTKLSKDATCPVNIRMDMFGRLVDAALWARDVWQVLFNIYRERGCDLHRMDSLLCDYEELKRWFSYHFGVLPVPDWFVQGDYFHKPVCLFWCGHKGGYTDFQSFEDDNHDIKIFWEPGSKEIFITTAPHDIEPKDVCV